MRENRMLRTIKLFKKRWIGWIYSLATVFLVMVFLDIGSMLGETTIWTILFVLPSQALQRLMMTMDPIFVDLLIFLFPTFLLFLWVLAVEHRSPKTLGFFPDRAWRELAKGWLIGFGLIGTVVGFQVLTGSIRFVQFNLTKENILSFFFIIPFWLIQSGTEEVLTRGWLFPVVSRHTRLWIGGAVSSLLFAVLHLQNPSVDWISIVNIALFGVLACLYVLKTDNIWGISAIHAAWNCFQGSFFGLNVSGLSTSYPLMTFENGNVSHVLSGDDFGPEASIFSSLVMGGYVLYLILDLHKKKVVE